jgi:flagellar motility protein MotE (MotC chaperone)
MNAPSKLSLVTAVAGVLAGVGIGAATLWRAADLTVAQVAAARHKPETAAAAARNWDFWSIEIDNLASELKEEKGRLRQQAELIDQRAARLATEQQELDKVRQDLETLRKEIAERVIEIDTAEAKNLRTLAQTYSGLTPTAAVTVIREMEDVTVVKILSLMKPDTVAAIFEEMSRTKSADGTLARRVAVLSEKLRLSSPKKSSS